MTNYNFDTLISRRGNNTMKWDMYPDALPMWVADMDFQSPPQVIEALTERVAHGIFGYQFDSPQLRTLICERMARLYNWEVTPGQIVFLPGLVPALFLTSRIFGDLNTGVLIQTPVY